MSNEVADRLRSWLIRWLSKREPCDHDWYVMIEHYPTYAWNQWGCKLCRLAENSPDDEPPVPVTLEICNMGHVHTVEAPELQAWPETIYE